MARMKRNDFLDVIALRNWDRKVSLITVGGIERVRILVGKGFSNAFSFRSYEHAIEIVERELGVIDTSKKRMTDEELAALAKQGQKLIEEQSHA